MPSSNAPLPGTSPPDTQAPSTPTVLPPPHDHNTRLKRSETSRTTAPPGRWRIHNDASRAIGAAANDVAARLDRARRHPSPRSDRPVRRRSWRRAARRGPIVAGGTTTTRLVRDLVRAGSRSTTAPVDAASRRVTLLADATAQGADGVSVTLGSGTGSRRVASSNDTARWMDHHPHRKGQGSCLSAAPLGAGSTSSRRRTSTRTAQIGQPSSLVTFRWPSTILPTTSM